MTKHTIKYYRNTKIQEEYGWWMLYIKKYRSGSIRYFWETVFHFDDNEELASFKKELEIYFPKESINIMTTSNNLKFSRYYIVLELSPEDSALMQIINRKLIWTPIL